VGVIIIFAVVVVLGITGYVFFKNQGLIPNKQETSEQTVTKTITPSVTEAGTSDWKTYTNKEYGFSFKYPELLTLAESKNSVTLSHSIPYENYGGCDMTGGNTLYKNLEDFRLTFEVKNQQIKLNYTDGQYVSGNLKGVYALEGAEGCGNVKYVFPLVDEETLVVDKGAVQALSGLSKYWNLEEILEVPDVISQEESKSIFDQILSTFEFTGNNQEKNEINYTELVSKAKSKGRVSVIVELKTNYTVESKLEPDEIKSQRENIQKVQNELIQSLQKYDVEVYKRYQVFPTIALHIDYVALQFLINSPFVKIIQEDKPVGF